MTETFSEEVIRRREASRLSQSGLAVLSGVGRNTISNVERGLGVASVATMRKLRRSFNSLEGDPTESSDLTTEPADRQGRALELSLREQIARQIEALADAYPEGGSDVIRGARHAYQVAALIARGDPK